MVNASPNATIIQKPGGPVDRVKHYGVAAQAGHCSINSKGAHWMLSATHPKWIPEVNAHAFSCSFHPTA